MRMSFQGRGILSGDYVETLIKIGLNISVVFKKVNPRNTGNDH